MSNNYKRRGRFQDIFEKYSAFSKEGKCKLDEDLVHQIPPKAMLDKLRNVNNCQYQLFIITPKIPAVSQALGLFYHTEIGK